MEANPAKLFLAETLEEGNADPVRANHLYHLYQKWVRDSGHYALSAPQFGKEVFRMFPAAEKKRPRCGRERVWCYTGITYQDGIIGYEDWSQAYVTREEGF